MFAGGEESRVEGSGVVERKGEERCGMRSVERVKWSWRGVAVGVAWSGVEGSGQKAPPQTKATTFMGKRPISSRICQKIASSAPNNPNTPANAVSKETLRDTTSISTPSTQGNNSASTRTLRNTTRSSTPSTGGR
jgi:hypothetical protein